MDAKVDDFLNEINEIAPPPKKIQKNESVWKECQDELTGYTYYWNTKTDEVTWTAPPEFKNRIKQNVQNTNITSKPPVPQKKVTPPENLKIYSVQNDSGKIAQAETKPSNTTKPQKRTYKPNKSESDSEDEKIVLISSYGGDSESEDEEANDKEQKKKVVDPPPKKIKQDSLLRNDSYQSEEEDDLDILARIQKRAQELKELGGELPPEVAKITNIPDVKPPTIKEKKAVSGFSLVAGYSDSEEEDNAELKNVFAPKPEPQPQVSHSTLFPIPQPVNVKDFQPEIEEKKDEEEKPSEFGPKAFQRKKRIGVALMNTAKKKEPVVDEAEDTRRGFGFKKDSVAGEKTNLYPGFDKGGVMFVKSDVLNPPLPKSEEVSTVSNKVEEAEENAVDKAKVEEMYSTLLEKLVFLNSGHPVIPPTQTMVVQVETLYVAMKDGGLKLSYLRKWLTETCSELVKLEKDATPEGWLLLWDRSHKRYYYQNRTTGVSQWEYPQPDSQTCDDAMDISTTPPPEQIITMSPPMPPAIRSPTPPPPPIISAIEETLEAYVLPLQPQPVPPPNPTLPMQPLPPGVEMSDMSFNKPEEQAVKPQDPLHSALDSFYSDIAAIENPNAGEAPQQSVALEETKTAENSSVEAIADNTKKKKKKVKLAPGLSLKKKGVSQLVEKWKTVQQHFND